MLDMTASFGGWEGGITAVSRPSYIEKNGCLYVDFGQTSEGTAAREAAMPGIDMPVTAFMREWLRMMETQVRHNTMDCYRYMFRRHIQPFFDSRRLTFRNIAVSDFQAFVDTKYQEGYSPTSILKFHTVIHKCMKYAVIQGLLEHNLSGYVILPKRKRYIGRTFNLEQLGRFLEEARSSPAEPAFMLAAAYGLRRSEAAGLRWQCVDFAAGCITINHTAISSSGKVTYSDRVKTDSSYRTLPLMDGIREYLLWLRKEQQEMRLYYGPDYYQSDYVCCRADGKPLRPDYISQEFAKVCKRVGLPHIRLHDLRHTAATILLQQGFSLKHIQEWLGHADITTTANTYAHVAYSDKKEMAEQLDQLLPLKSSG